MGPKSENWPLVLLITALVVGVIAVTMELWLVVAAMILLSVAQVVTLMTQRRNRR